MRIVSALIFLLLTLGLISVIEEKVFTLSALVPVLVMLLLLFCLLYRDSWVFDNNIKKITYTWGFGPFVRKLSLDYCEIDRIEVSFFIKGITGEQKAKPSWKHKQMIVLSLRLDEEKKYDLEILGEKKSGRRLRRDASYLSAFTGLPLYTAE